MSTIRCVEISISWISDIIFNMSTCARTSQISSGIYSNLIVSPTIKKIHNILKKIEMYSIFLIMFPQHSSLKFRLKLLMCARRLGWSKGQMLMSARGEWSPQDEFVYLREGSGVWRQLSRFYYVNLIIIIYNFPEGPAPPPTLFFTSRTSNMLCLFDFFFNTRIGQCKKYIIDGKVIQENYGADCSTHDSPCPPFYNSAEAYKCQY